MDHHPDCIQGFGCHCTTAPHVEFQLTRPPSPVERWLASIGGAVVWFLRWP